MKDPFMKRPSWIVVFIIIVFLAIPAVQGAEIDIFPIDEIWIGQWFEIRGTTNLAVGEDLLVEVYSSSFSPTSKKTSGEYSGLTGTTKVVRGTKGINTWSFQVDTSAFHPGEYITKVSSITEDVSASTSFILTLPPTTLPPTTTPLIANILISSQPPGAEIWIDGQSKGVTPKEVNYPGPGTYALELTLPGYKSYTENQIIQVGTPHEKVVYLEPVASITAAFSATPTSGNTPLTVTFTDLSTGSPATWFWSFGDGATSTAQNPSHQYTEAGSYTVTLTVTGTGGTDEEIKANYITVAGVPPLAYILISSQPAGAEIWIDGQSKGVTPKEVYYPGPGTYALKLTLPGYKSYTENQIIQVGTPHEKVVYLEPVASITAAFSATPTSGNAPLTVTFIDLSTGSPAIWFWSFGDGGTSTAQNPSHQYTEAGSYTVTLTVTGTGGTDKETKTNYITVAGIPPLAYILISSQPAGAEIWIDGQSKGVTPKQVNFPGPGTYALKLTLGGYKPYSGSLSIQSGTPHEKEVIMESLGTISVSPTTPITTSPQVIPGMEVLLSILAVGTVVLLYIRKRK